jgi:hypothetical protein
MFILEVLDDTYVLYKIKAAQGGDAREDQEALGWVSETPVLQAQRTSSQGLSFASFPQRGDA